MNVILVDDERLILLGQTAMVQKLLPNAAVSAFRTADDAVSYAKENRVDIALLDISLERSSGLALSHELKSLNPRVNIIFCTGYSEYALDAFDLLASSYLLKPLSEERLQTALANLRYPISEEKKAVTVKCFGHFEVTMGGTPVEFKYARTKEVFAYLIDQKGAVLSTRELMAALFEEDSKGSYFRNLKYDLINTFQSLGAGDILIQKRGRLGIRREEVDCDYFDYLNGRTELFHGEYMNQYSFGEETLAHLSISAMNQEKPDPAHT